MLNWKVWTLSVGCWMATTFTLCVLGGVIAPGLPIPHQTLELLLPAFKWISLEAFVLGFVESFLYGVYTGLLFVSIHNFWWRHWSTTSSDTSATVRAA
jgi:hypothetical protein